MNKIKKRERDEIEIVSMGDQLRNISEMHHRLTLN